MENSVSPAFDESVIGFRDDKQPSRSGIMEILAVVQILEAEGIPCCAVAESALIYYGAGRLRWDWLLSVPTDDLYKATAAISSHELAYSSFRPSAMKALGGMHHLYPRFKVIGLRLFFILTTAQECHIPCSPENFERSSCGMPYPKLSVYAQSLIDTNNLLDLEDLVDGMNLSVEWGIENLELDGDYDGKWGLWKIDTLQQTGLKGLQLPLQLKTPCARRKIWESTACSAHKIKRQGWKLLDNHPTRFWHEGQKILDSEKGLLLTPSSV